MEELMVPNDLPIEMIAEEVKESWRLKEVHVEKLMQKVSGLIRGIFWKPFMGHRDLSYFIWNKV